MTGVFDLRLLRIKIASLVTTGDGRDEDWASVKFILPGLCILQNIVEKIRIIQPSKTTSIVFFVDSEQLFGDNICFKRL